MKIIMVILIENNNNDDNNNHSDSDNDNNNNTSDDENNDNDNKLPVYSPNKGPIMLKFGVTVFFSLKPTVEFPVIWDAMSLT